MKNILITFILISTTLVNSSAQVDALTHLGANALWYCGWDANTLFDLNINHKGAYNINFLTAGTQRMTILGTAGATQGFVGINTAAPAIRLEVWDGTFGAAQLRLVNSVANFADFQVTNQSNLIIRPNSGSNCGIGNFTAGSPPQVKLDVLAPVNPQLRLSQNIGSVYTDFQTDGNGYLSVMATGGRIGLGGVPTVASGTHIFNTLRITPQPLLSNSTNILVIDANGDVGLRPFICGSGIALNHVAKASPANVLCESIIIDDGTRVGIPNNPIGTGRLEVQAPNSNGFNSIFSEALGTSSYGVFSKALATGSVGVRGDGALTGVQGIANGTSSLISGVYAQAIGTNNGANINAAVYATVGSGQAGSSNYGVQSFSQSTLSTNNIAVFGKASFAGTNNVGIQGWADPSTTSASNIGVEGLVNPATGGNVHKGVSGFATGATSQNCGVYGKITTAPNAAIPSAGVYGDYGGNATNAWAVYANGASGGTGLWITSDVSLKTDINDLKDASAILEKLQPKTYNFDTVKYPFMNLPSEPQRGFISEDVNAVCKELTKTFPYPAQFDTLGNKTHEQFDVMYLNYIGLIPVLVAGFQEQKVLIDNLQSQLDACCNSGMRLQDQGSNPSQTIKIISETTALLGDCKPNPTDGNTTITVKVPEKISEALIILTDQLGNEVFREAITHRGYSDLNIETSQMENGIYHYSLVADRKVIDTKQLVKQH